MWSFDYSSIFSIKQLLSEYGFTPTKERGQNFLISNSAREKIATSITAGLSPTDEVWEIGPGLGSITSLILKSGCKLKCFELDYGFISILKEAFKDEANFTLVEGDALETVFKEKIVPTVIAGNLPYNVGTVLIAKMFENQVLPERMVFTLQKEVAERLAFKNKNDRSSITTLASLSYDSKIIATLRPGDFWPSPKIDSSVVVLTKNDGQLYGKVKDSYGDFVKVNRALYALRRKTIKNNLSGIFADKTSVVLNELKLKENLRSDDLTIENIVDLSLKYTELKRKGEISET